MKLKLCGAKRERGRGRKLYDTAKLRDQNIKEQFHIEIQNRFEALANNKDDSIGRDWLDSIQYTVRAQMLFWGKGGQNQVKLDELVPKQTGEWMREGRSKSSLGESDLSD